VDAAGGDTDLADTEDAGNAADSGFEGEALERRAEREVVGVEEARVG